MNVTAATLSWNASTNKTSLTRFLYTTGEGSSLDTVNRGTPPPPPAPTSPQPTEPPAPQHKTHHNIQTHTTGPMCATTGNTKQTPGGRRLPTQKYLLSRLVASKTWRAVRSDYALSGKTNRASSRRLALSGCNAQDIHRNCSRPSLSRSTTTGAGLANEGTNERTPADDTRKNIEAPTAAQALAPAQAQAPAGGRCGSPTRWLRQGEGNPNPAAVAASRSTSVASVHRPLFEGQGVLRRALLGPPVCCAATGAVVVVAGNNAFAGVT